MSIRHCIAGVVLVVIGGLAVNAYQDQPKPENLPDGLAVRRKQADSEAVQRIEILESELKYAREVQKKMQDRLVALVADKPKPAKQNQSKENEDTVEIWDVAPGGPSPVQMTAWRMSIIQRQLAEAEQDLALAVKQVEQLAQSKQSSAAPSSSPVGRYQFIDHVLPNSNKAGLMYDTTTGHCWLLVGSEWNDLGSPPPAKTLEDLTPIPPAPKP